MYVQFNNLRNIIVLLCNEKLKTKKKAMQLIWRSSESVYFSDRTEALRKKTKKAKEVLSFVTTYNPATPSLKRFTLAHHPTAT